MMPGMQMPGMPGMMPQGQMMMPGMQMPGMQMPGMPGMMPGMAQPQMMGGMPGMPGMQQPQQAQGQPGSTGSLANLMPLNHPSATTPSPPAMNPGGTQQVVPIPGGIAPSGAPPARSAPAPAQPVEEKKAPTVPKCHLHKKNKAGCKFCTKYKEAEKVAEEEAKAAAAAKAAALANETSTRRQDKPGLDMLNAVLKDQILRNTFFKKLVANCEDHQTLVDELYANAEHAEPNGTGGDPSQFMCCVAWMLGVSPPTDESLKMMMYHKDSPFIRCAAFLFLRLSRADDLWQMCEPFVLDDEEFTPTRDKKDTCTMGVYVQELLLTERYFGTTMPRLPMNTKRKFEMELVGTDEWRKRCTVNKDRLEKFMVGTKVEALHNGDWAEGEITEVDDSMLSAIRVTVRMADGEETFSLGKIVLPWPKRVKRERDRSRSAGEGKSRSRSRSRGRDRKEKEKEEDRNRSRTPDRHDWTYYKGTRQSDLVEKWRAQEKEKALSSGRERPKNDGYVPNVFRPVPGGGDRRGRGGPQVSAEEEAELKAQEQRRQMEKQQQEKMALMAKYTASSAATASKKEQEGPDVIRLG